MPDGLIDGGILGMQNRAQPAQPQMNNGSLPYQQDQHGGMQDLQGLINQYKGASAPQAQLDQASQIARQEAAVRGLGGSPLDASMSTLAQTHYMNQFNQYRGQMLQGLLGQQNQQAMGAQAAEEARRKYMYQQALQAYQAKRQQDHQLWGNIAGVGGAIIGGIGGTFLSPGIGTIGGASAGWQAGQMLGGMGSDIGFDNDPSNKAPSF